jgi:hypothetical protein
MPFTNAERVTGSPLAAPEVRIYAAQLDAEMCPACAAHAGIEYQPRRQPAPAIPNPACTSP